MPRIAQCSKLMGPLPATTLEALAAGIRNPASVKAHAAGGALPRGHTEKSPRHPRLSPNRIDARHLACRTPLEAHTATMLQDSPNTGGDASPWPRRREANIANRRRHLEGPGEEIKPKERRRLVTVY